MLINKERDNLFLIKFLVCFAQVWCRIMVRYTVLRDKFTMLLVYKVLVRPHLEYCVQLWNPVHEHGNWGLIKELEGVQRRFTRLVDGIGTLPYSERLNVLGLTTLAERRARGDLIETFKAVKGFTCLEDLFHVSRSGYNLVSHVNVSSKSKCSTKIKKMCKSFLSERVIMLWNSLPVFVKSSETVNIFKSRLECFKKNNIDKISHFWSVSKEVLERIEDPSYFINKERHNVYLKENRYVAHKQFINLNETST